MCEEIWLGWDFMRLAAVLVPNVMSLWLSLMVGSILMRVHPSLADELFFRLRKNSQPLPWPTRWWHAWWAGGHEQMNDVQQHPNAESSIQQRTSAAAPALRCLAPLCFLLLSTGALYSFYEIPLVHVFRRGFFCLLINLRVQRMWIVVDNNISWQSYDY